jgi:DNA-binding transcriptional LysR family regulator
MNPHQLELFYYVAKARGVSRAVRLMPYGIQQPTVSSQVNALERDLGVTLYERRPFKLTPAGEELFRFVEPFFGRLAEVREKLHGAAQLRIGASPIVFRDYLLPVIDAVRRQFPRLNLILRALNQPQLLDALHQDELDVVISLIPDNPGPAISASEIVRLPLVLLAPARSKIKSAKQIWESAAIAEPLIALPPHELICQRFQQTLAELGVRWLPTIEMDSLDLIEKYVAAGYGIGLSVRLPEKKPPAKIRAVELPGFPELRLGVLHRHESKTDDAVCRAFLAELTRQAARFVRP